MTNFSLIVTDKEAAKDLTLGVTYIMWTSLGGTPTWDLDELVHGTAANHAGWPSELFT